MNLGIEYLDYYVPKNRVSIEEFIEIIPEEVILKYYLSKEKCLRYCKKDLMLKSIPVENKLEDFQTLEILLDKMFDSKVIGRNEIDVIILAQESYNYSLENIGQYIQNKYEMNNAFVFNVSGNHCNDVELAIRVSKGLMAESNEIKNILIISSSQIKDMSDRLAGKICVLGDGAGILLLKKDGEQFKILDTNNSTNGYFYDFKMGQDNYLLHYRYGVNSISNILERNNLNSEQIKKVIIQNINPELRIHYFDRFGIGKDKIFMDNIGKYGHITCIDFIANLKDLKDLNILNKNDILLCLGLGLAGSYQATLLSY